jgi:hypothetical protein
MYDTENLPDLGWEGTVEPVLDFDISPPTGGEDASEVEVRMSSLNRALWDYDHGRYFRSQDGAESVDTEDVQISADSVVVVWVHTVSTGRFDAAGSPVPDYEVTGTGAAIVFRDGEAFEGEWKRETEDDFFSFEDLDGHPIPLPPGRTWIHITPLSGSVTWS